MVFWGYCLSKNVKVMIREVCSLGWHMFSRSLATLKRNLVTSRFLKDGVKSVQTVNLTQWQLWCN